MNTRNKTKKELVKELREIQKEYDSLKTSYEKNITGLKRAEEKLKENEFNLLERDTLFKKLSSHIPGMIYQFMKKPDGTYCMPFTTEAIRDIFGCSPRDVRDDFSPITRVILAEDLDNVMGSIEHSAKNLTTWQCGYRVQIPGQPVRWMFGQATPEKLADGSIIWYGFNADITEHKQTEILLRKLNHTYAVWSEINKMIVRVHKPQEIIRGSLQHRCLIGRLPHGMDRIT